MPPPEPLIRLVASARRRLWASRLTGEVAVGLGVGAAGAGAVWGISRVVVLPWADGVAVFLVLMSFVWALGWWAIHRPSPAQAALWADHRLGGQDRLATAWELSRYSQVGRAGTRQIEAAGRWAAHQDPRRLGGDFPSLQTVILAAVAVLSAGLLGASFSLTDQALAESRIVREMVDREVEAVENLAAEAPEGLSERLTELAERLESARTLDEAASELSLSRLELEERIGPNRLAESTALSGLVNRLAQHPVGRGEDPASQLADLASSLGGLSPAQLQTAAQELADRAADFAGINDELSSALAEAASALSDADLDPSLVSEALTRAASEISSAQLQSTLDASSAEAAARLADSEARLRNAQQRSGQGQGEGQGSGQGQGEGQGSGQGEGQGSGQGQGEGQGQGQGGGSGGSGGGPADASGLGGGTVGGVGDNDPARSPEYSSSVFEPPPAGLGEEVHVSVEGSDPGEVVGSSQAPSVANAALVPYTERFSEYRSAALASLDRRPLPSHLTEVVQSYFTELEP